MPPLKHIQPHYERAKVFFFHHERLLMPAMLVFGFLVDYVTFTTIQISTALTVLTVYWCGAGLTILFIHLYDEEKLSSKLRFVRLFAPLLLQFFFGALLGGSFIFYWFSGTLSVSWPFIVILAVLMVSNDIFRHHFQRPLLQIGVYFFVSFSLFSVILPFAFNSLSPWLFIGAGVLSTVVIYGYTSLLARISKRVATQTPLIRMLVVAILVGMNLLYFTAVIPPIPLSIREAGIYHDIEKEGSTYVLAGEEEHILEKLIPGQTLHIQPNQRIYAYSAIFAPAQLNTTIWHHWEYWNSERNRWVSRDRLSFNISGGRDAGYRGFTWKSNLTPGRWRVGVETDRGQVLGRMRFRVIHTSTQAELRREIR